MRKCLWCRTPYDPATRQTDEQICPGESHPGHYCSDECAQRSDEQLEQDDAERASDDILYDT